MKTTVKMLIGLYALICSITVAAQKPSPELLTPDNHVLVLVDHEGQMAFAVENLSIGELRNNTAIVAGGSKIFKIPTVVTTVSEKSFSGPVFPELLKFYPKETSGYIDRTTMNCWEDARTQKAIVVTGKKKVVFAGLWTSVCIAGPVLSAIADGYEVYVITDACGDVSKEAHDVSILRMIQVGAKPMTSTQYVLELQRDWARSATYGAVTGLFKEYGGAYGIGIQYAGEMLKH